MLGRNGALLLAIGMLGLGAAQLGAASSINYMPVKFEIAQRPAKPACAGEIDSVESCRNAIERYSDEVRRYLDYLDKETSEALREHNAAVNAFNCKASGTRC
ncbi:MAG TPA: hypothetical protein VHN11_12045 [Xanthobacteraceae bacterium]|jgi:hypothetical protein|nr:hypothetical protein [Xanthobacteraceae bacterium]